MVKRSMCVTWKKTTTKHSYFYQFKFVDKFHSGMNFTTLLACSHIPTPSKMTAHNEVFNSVISINNI